MSPFYFATLVTIAFATSSAAFAANGGVEDYRQPLDEVRAMRSNLAESGLSGFLEIATTNGWTAPWIHSVSWVAWLRQEPREKVLFEHEKRDFGHDLLTQLNCEAFRILDPADGKTRKAQAELLFRFSSWIGKSRGYGNFALMMRSENLACIPIGHLAVDLDCPIDDVEALVAQFTPLMERLAFQVDILNEEAPHKFEVPNIEIWENDLDLQWQRKLAPAWKAYKKFKNIKHGNPRIFADGEGMPKEYWFYLDDRINTEPYSLSNSWHTKDHFAVCIRGCTDNIRWKTEKALMFRKVLGRLPLKPVHSHGRFDSEIREAFYEAWEPHVRQYGKAASSAAFVYEAARENSFMDYDTECLVRFLGMPAPVGETNTTFRSSFPVSEALITKYRKWQATK